ncbi:MAG: VCBS repeat-containing protein, partial [Cyclobacteriaceae bacterium]|nr:VCBS repeat-containing protein [Cyclobacteriaceae bacterium]
MRNLLLIAVLLLLPGISLAQITSTFDIDADGWTLSDNNNSDPQTVNFFSTGGNPGGYVAATKTSSSQPYFWTSPSKFGGNIAYFCYGQDLSFDLQVDHVATVHGAAGDVQIKAPSGSILALNLATFPAQAPAWSNFTVRLDETAGWRVGSIGGPVATKAQMIQYLSGLSSFRINIKYNSGVTTFTGAIDNVTLNQRTVPSSPSISSISVTSGNPGTSISINGTNFDPSPANNVVYFGGVAGTITNATATSLKVTIPNGAQYGQLMVTNKTTGLSKLTDQPFTPTFTEGGRIIPASFNPKFDILITGGYGGLSIADMDGDGWNDLVVARDDNTGIWIYRNLGSGGTLSLSSFDTPVSFPTLLSGTNGSGLQVVDFDNDGKLDMVTSGWTGGPGVFATFRNTSIPGTVSFEAVEYWSGRSDESPVYNAADIDGDGLPELISGEGSGGAGQNVWITQNMSTPGNIEFGYSILYFSSTLDDAPSSATIRDLNNDGKPEFILVRSFGGIFTVFTNTSTPGSISFGTNFSITEGIGGGINVADFNGDGKNDLAWKNGFSNDDVHIRLNTDTDGLLTDTDFATEIILDSEVSTYGSLSIADINGDNKPDILATDNADVGIFENVFSGGAFSSNAFVPGYRFQGNGGSTYPATAQAADLNGDNKPDIVVGITNTSPDRLSIYENKNVHAPVISVNTVSPLNGAIGSTVTITGSNFSTISTENEVYFGAVQATVLTATTNELTVSVPPGATYVPVSVRRGELMSRYRLPFATTFSPGVTFNNTHFAPPINFTFTNANYDIEVGDLNRDGKPDILAEASGGFAFRNTYITGALSTSSLVADDTLSAGSFINPRLEDFDGDGFLDAASVNGLAHRNISTSTEISFQPSVTLGLGASTMDVADFNNDGKTDLTVTTDLSGSGDLLILENRSVAGSFTTGTYGSFSGNIIFNKPAPGGGVVSEDFDGDGFVDVATTNVATDNISIYRNAGILKISIAQFASRLDLAVGDSPGRIYKGDFDGDGKVDLMLYHGGTATTLLTIFHNTSTVGNISFTRIDLTNPSATTVATIADLDGDGKPEIITTSESGNRFSIFKNVYTSGALTAASFAAPFNTTVTAPRGITTGDINLDGKPEIILTRAAGLLVVYENLVGNPLITSFNPTSGPVGTTVTITGENFSPTPANNMVTFNGIAAVVTASTPTSITTSVPAGATTGVLSVTVSGATGISATPFTVTSPVLIPGLVWARGHIGTTDTFSEAVTTDASGNVYTTGSFDQTTDFDPGPGVLNLTSAGNADIYVSKLNANGDLAWAFSMGGVTSDAGTGIATDASGNVYVAGSFSGTVDFDPGPGTTNLTGGGKFLCKFDTNGILISAIALPGTLSFDIPLAVDAADNLYLAGSFTGTADFDPGAGVFNLTSAGSSDIFVLKLSSTGSFIWAKRMGSTSLDRANALALDVNGNVHITGTFNGTVDFDPGAGTANLTSAGATDAFIQKLDNAGNYMWARRVGGTSSLDTGNGIVLDRNDNVLVTGRFDGTVDFDPGAAVNNLTSVGGGDVFVLKLTSAGIFDWAKSMGGTFADEGIDIVCDAFDNVYTTGDFRSNTADFDPGPGTFNLTPTGSEEVFLSGLDAAGNFMWAIASQGAAGSSVYQPELSLDATGNIILIGVIEDAPADLDPGICVTNISTNGVTAFIVKLRPGTISSCGPTITITQQPASPTYACENSSASFTTAATGTTNITYQWQKYDGSVFVDLPNNATYSGVSMATLIINNVSTAEAGEYQCVISGDFAADVLTDVADLVVNNLPAPPGVVNGLNCGPGAVTLTASGGSPGNYRWYTDSPTLIAGEVNESFTTPVLTSTTSYFVSLVDPFCESLRVTVTATVNPLPAKPTITSSILPSAGTVTVCDAAPLVLSAPAGFTAYAWSSGETTDQINVTVAGSYTVTVTDAASCTSPGSDPILVITDTTPALPTVATAASCGPGSVALTASGGTNGNYRWYDVATGGTALAGEVNSMFTTPAL